MKYLLTAWIALATSLLLVARAESGGSLGEIKRWQLHSQRGEITAKLSASSDRIHHGTVLVIEPDGDYMPTASEEVALLAQVMGEMSALGYEPREMEIITTWLQNSEYRAGVQRSVAESGKWKSCTGRKYCHEAEPVANHYFESVEAFKPFDEVLRHYGLIRKSVRMDDMGVGEKPGHISCSGLVVITLGKAG